MYVFKIKKGGNTITLFGVLKSGQKSGCKKVLCQFSEFFEFSFVDIGHSLTDDRYSQKEKEANSDNSNYQKKPHSRIQEMVRKIIHYR